MAAAVVGAVVETAIRARPALMTVAATDCNTNAVARAMVGAKVRLTPTTSPPGVAAALAEATCAVA